MLNPV